MIANSAPRKPRRSWLLVWLVPALWLANSYVSSEHPGDEYGMFFVGALAGSWLVMIFGNAGTVQQAMFHVLILGTIVMAAMGLLLTLLRASRVLWIATLVLVAAAIVTQSLLSYPSLQRAISKNGSITAYVCLGVNFGSYVATVVSLVVAIPMRLLERRPRPGRCAVCDYDLTGNVSGRCPECGAALTEKPA